MVPNSFEETVPNTGELNRFKKSMRIVFDRPLPKWNYRAVPEPV